MAATPGLDPFCSRSDWLIAYHLSHAPERPVVAVQEDGAAVALALIPHQQLGVYAAALEQGWGFAAPCAGARGPALLARLLSEPGAVGAGALLASGLPHPLLGQLIAALGQGWLVVPAGRTRRVVASLEGGLAAFVGRRSRGFRRNLRRAERAGRDAGLSFEQIAPTRAEDCGPLYDRVLAVERRSWKALQWRGVDQEPMRGFYCRLLPRLAAAGQLRLLFARQGDRDVGYMHGGQLGGHFRALQFSYDRGLAALGVGNLMHVRMIAWVASLGATFYDLGMDIAYKRRWADGEHTTPNLWLVRRS